MNNTYKLKTKTVAEIVSLTDMKLYLKVDESADDALITALINSAVAVAEKYMNRDLLTAVYENYRDEIDQDLTLRKAQFIAVSGIQYRHDGVYQNVPEADYQVAGNGTYGKIYYIELPDGYDDHPEAIKIVFTAGYGASGSLIPADIITGIKAHVAFMYENRGDCDSIPPMSKIIYDNYKVVELNGVM